MNYWEIKASTYILSWKCIKGKEDGDLDLLWNKLLGTVTIATVTIATVTMATITVKSGRDGSKRNVLLHQKTTSSKVREKEEIEWR